jgi:hypothetical protein
MIKAQNISTVLKVFGSFVSLHGTARTHTYKPQDDLELHP